MTFNYNDDNWRFVVIDGYLFSDYAVLDTGHIYSFGKQEFLPGAIDKKGYVRYTLIRYDENGNKIRKGASAHRIVMESFGIYHDKEQDQVDHIDGNKQNNSITNLEWVDCMTNIRRSWEMGLHDNDIRYGENSSTSKYTNKQVEESCKLKLQGLTNRKISKMTGIHVDTLSLIFNGKRWNHISSKYGFKKK